MNFNNLSELKERLTPALKLKVEDLEKQGIELSTEDLWKTLALNVWCKKTGLTLSDMVNDILKYNK